MYVHPCRLRAHVDAREGFKRPVAQLPLAGRLERAGVVQTLSMYSRIRARASASGTGPKAVEAFSAM